MWSQVGLRKQNYEQSSWRWWHSSWAISNPWRWCSICQQIWKTQQWPQDWKMSLFIPIPKKGNVKECSNYCTIALTSQVSKIMLKILLARFQQYVNWELPDVQAGVRKGRGPRDQIATYTESRKTEGNSKKHIYLFVIDYAKAFVWITTNWNILNEMEIPGHITCRLRNLYAGQEAEVRTGHGTNRLVPNWESSRSRYIVTLLI